MDNTLTDQIPRLLLQDPLENIILSVDQGPFRLASKIYVPDQLDLLSQHLGGKLLSKHETITALVNITDGEQSFELVTTAYKRES